MTDKRAREEIPMDQMPTIPFSYKPGGTTLGGEKIATILDQEPDWVIFRNDKGELAWEHRGLPKRLKPAEDEFYRLEGLAKLSLPPSKREQMEYLLASTLARVFGSQANDDVIAYFKPARDFLEKQPKIAGKFASGPDFMVCRTERDSVEWWHRTLPYRLRAAAAELDRLQGIAQSTLPKTCRPEVAIILGKALSSAFMSREEDDLSGCFEVARNFVNERGKGYAQLNYLSFSLSWALILLCILEYQYLFLDSLTPFHRDIILGGGGGILGGAISIMQRARKLSIDPFASRLHMAFHGVIRITLALIFGCFVVVVSKANLALGIIQDNPYTLFVIAVVAGFSERFVPGLIERIGSDHIAER